MIAALLVGARAATSQSQGSVAGIVRRSTDSVPVSDAYVELVLRAQTRTDSVGAFNFRRVKAGRHELRVRRLGFEPFTRYVEVPASGAATYVVGLVPLPVELKEIRIAGKRITVPFRFEDVYRRAASGFGHFITVEDIAQRKPFYVREALNGIPGLTVDNYRVRFRRCGDANNSSNIVESTKVQVYIDGRRMTRFDRGGTDVDAALSMVPISSVQAIEVYVGIAQIPAEFHDDACAVIAIWTKRY